MHVNVVIEILFNIISQMFVKVNFYTELTLIDFFIGWFVSVFEDLHIGVGHWTLGFSHAIVLPILVRLWTPSMQTKEILPNHFFQTNSSLSEKKLATKAIIAWLLQTKPEWIVFSLFEKTKLRWMIISQSKLLVQYLHLSFIY